MKRWKLYLHLTLAFGLGWVANWAVKHIEIYLLLTKLIAGGHIN